MANITRIGQLGVSKCDTPGNPGAASQSQHSGEAELPRGLARSSIRRADWLEKLFQILDAARDRRFAFGDHDCVRLVGAVLDAMTGSDWRPYIDALYKNERAALRLMRKGELEKLVTRALNRKPVPINLARRGDVVALNLENGPALGVCVGERVAVASDGVLYLPLERAHCAWLIE